MTSRTKLLKQDPAGRDRSVMGPVTKFALSGLLTLLLVAIGGALEFRSLGEDEAIKEARRITKAIGVGVIEENLGDDVVRGDPEAVERFDKVVQRAVLEEGEIVRVKIWTAEGSDQRSGRIVYSDESELINDKFPLEGDELAALHTDVVKAEVSDLSREENLFERREGKLLEVYMPVHTPSGQPLLFEAYMSYSSVSQSGQRIWSAFAPILIGGLLVIWVVQVPLATSLARRLRDRQKEREMLLHRAIEASDAERRRIASDLHDGVVQDLAGLSYELSAASQDVHKAPRTGISDALGSAADSVRHAIRQLRTLLVDIHPPNLHTEGLEAALADLATPLERSGVTVSFDLPPAFSPPADVEALVFRATQEALRNILAYAQATRVVVLITEDRRSIVLTVEDDGKGFSPPDVERRMAEGHFGLRLLSELTSDAGGELRVDSAPGRGTKLRMEVPAA